MNNAITGNVPEQKPRWITAADVREIIRVSATTLWRLTKRPGFPKPTKIGDRCKVWREDEILNWLENNREKEA